MITVKIDTTMLDKTLMYTSPQTGKMYLDVVLKEYKEGKSKYGDTHFVIQSVSKEHNQALKDKGERMPIIGNAKQWEKKEWEPKDDSKTPPSSASRNLF